MAYWSTPAVAAGLAGSADISGRLLAVRPSWPEEIGCLREERKAGYHTTARVADYLSCSRTSRRPRHVEVDDVSGGVGVERVGLALGAALTPVGPVHLNNPHTLL